MAAGGPLSVNSLPFGPPRSLRHSVLPLVTQPPVGHVFWESAHEGRRCPYTSTTGFASAATAGSDVARLAEVQAHPRQGRREG